MRLQLLSLVVESTVEVPQIQCINGECPALRNDIETPRAQFLDKVVRGAASGEHRQGRRRSCDHAEALCACVVYGGFWNNFHVFYVPALFSWKSGIISSSPLVSGSHFPRCTCVRIWRLLDEFQPFFYVKVDSWCCSHNEIWTIFQRAVRMTFFFQKWRICVTFTFFALVPGFRAGARDPALERTHL